MGIQIKESILNKLLKPKTSKEMFWDAFGVFKFTKEHRKKQIILTLLCLVPAFLIGCSENTVGVFNDITGTILASMLAIFGVVFSFVCLRVVFILSCTL